MSDGSRLHDSWLTALKNAQTRFRSLLAASSSESWRKVPTPSASRDSVGNGISPVAPKGKARPRASDVVVYRKTGKGDDVIRIVLELPAEDGLESLESWKAVLTTPEMRKEWDPTVESSHTVETCFDPDTRISKTDFTLGWPANPRDAITISRTFTDATTLVDITTSLPRSPDEPAYLRPAPPYVRSHVHLFAWCVQLVQPSSDSNSKASSSSPRVRVTCFWQHDLKAIWGMANLSQNLPSMVVGLIRAVRKRGSRIPTLSGWGHGIGIDNLSFNVGRDALRLDYSVFPEDAAGDQGFALVPGSEHVDLKTIKERKRLERGLEVVLPLSQGWDIQISTRAPSEESSKLPWTVHATRIATLPDPPQQNDGSPTPQTPSTPTQFAVLRISHSRPKECYILKVNVVIELSGGSNGLRVNGLPHAIMDTESRDPVSWSTSKEVLEDATSISGISLQTVSTTGSQSSNTTQLGSPTIRSSVDRSPAAEKQILSLVRRNYIYFTSLLQEPEAKWRHVNESRGVTISQLDSIDPTLVVYRAEAVFVGIGVWDLLSIVKTPGAKVYWDRGYDDAVLLEDVNELTELWHHTTKAAWPVTARDNVLLTTSYKSPTSIHVFSFSTDDKHLFPCIPETGHAVIRTQVDLQGWAIEALSPTTTLLTLLDQSDPKGWSNKASIPQQMIAALAGVGEFAIKCGGPPVATRFGGGIVTSMKYDHEKSTFKVEYEASESRRHSLISANDMLVPTPTETVIDLSSAASGGSRPKTPVRSVAVTELPRVECELRCDIETWGSTLELVVDPPPQGVSCLKRHRLSSGGGGLWITVEHDALFVGSDRLMVVVRKGVTSGSKDRGAVIVNGLRVKVDVEELPESEVKQLTKQKRVKPVRIPLDQPPVLGVIRRRRVEWEDDTESDMGTDGSPKSPKDPSPSSDFSAPFKKFISAAVEQTVNTTAAAAAAFTPASYVNSSSSPDGSALDSQAHPTEQALRVLSYLRSYHAQPSSDGWTIASDKGGLPIYKKADPSFSTAIAIHKAEKVIEGISAGEVSAAITNLDCQKVWDDRFASYIPLEDYGYGCSTAFLVKRSGFPFRDRAFWVATVVARLKRKPGTPEADEPNSLGAHKSAAPPHSPTMFIASASFHPSSSSSDFAIDKINPTVYPTGQLIMSGWIIEAIDPYQEDCNYQIPSTRCVHFVAVDYRGSVPVAFNNTMNSTLPRSEIMALETWLKGKAGIGSGPLVRIPASNILVDAIVTSPSQTRPGTGDASNQADDWVLEPQEEGRTLLWSQFDSTDKVLNARLALRPALLRASRAHSPILRPRSRPPSISSPSPRPFAGRISPVPRSSTTPSSSTISQSSSGSASSSVTLRDRRSSGTTPPTRPSIFTHQRFPSSPHATLSSSPLINAIGERPRPFSPDNDQTLEHSMQDPVVLEVVINPAMFPDGYQVELTSAIASKTGSYDKKQKLPSTEGPTPPFSVVVYTIPPSPLLSSASDAPAPRHLLCIALPVAQYYSPVIVDPLTNEKRLPPPKPSWLCDLENRGLLVDVGLKGVPGTSAKQGAYKVLFNGKDIGVISERRSVAGIGREYLEDDGTQYMPLLKRASTQGADGYYPFDKPLAVDASLLRQPTSLSRIVDDPKPEDGARSDAPPEADPPVPASEPQTLLAPPARSSSQFFNFWNASGTLLGLARSPAPSPTLVETPAIDKATPKVQTRDEQDTLVKAGGSDTSSETTTAVSSRCRSSMGSCTYPLSTVIIIALISFLFGSLIRSLASPADFIYFVSTPDTNEALAQAAQSDATGWREVRRLLEFKRGLFGWDVVVAVVRRPDT
ncbi:hypothetical protein FRB99_005097 [Tulasnella sp. 403]|nr:hypothetical protein FRB99_005097 [Tulasnella sp. 403]